MTIDAAHAQKSFLGLDFTDLTFDRLASELSARPAEARFAYLVTPNVDHMVRLVETSPDTPAGVRLWSAYADADYRCCDSRVLAALARLKAVHLPVVPGSDLTVRLLEETAGFSSTINIVGGNETVLQLLKSKYEGIEFVQHIPPMGMLDQPEAMEAAADFVCRSPARYTFLAIGSPQQEILAHMVSRRGTASGLGFCIGAGVDFAVGLQRRSPRWMQKCHIEWLFRLFSDPKRMWRRYLVTGPRIVGAVWTR